MNLQKDFYNALSWITKKEVEWFDLIFSKIKALNNKQWENLNFNLQRKEITAKDIQFYKKIYGLN